MFASGWKFTAGPMCGHEAYSSFLSCEKCYICKPPQVLVCIYQQNTWHSLPFRNWRNWAFRWTKFGFLHLLLGEQWRQQRLCQMYWLFRMRVLQLRWKVRHTNRAQCIRTTMIYLLMYYSATSLDAGMCLDLKFFQQVNVILCILLLPCETVLGRVKGTLFWTFSGAWESWACRCHMLTSWPFLRRLWFRPVLV